MDTDSQINLLPPATPPDSFTENPLFAAARTEASAQQIIDLIHASPSINALNSDGQTFLFTLSPSSFQNLDHFLTLIKALDKHDFNFGHLDHDGRSFLSVLATKPGFEISCIQLAFRAVTCHCENRPQNGTACIHSIKRRRDAAGKFLVDYLVTHLQHKDPRKVLNAYEWSQSHSKMATVTADQSPMEAFNLCFPEKAFPNSRMRVQLHEEDDQGRTKVGAKIIVTGEFEANGERNVKVELGHYDIHGETPVMGYFKTALEKKVEEDVVAGKVEGLVKLGANVDARSRHGRTLLHFAAKHAWPVVIQKLLELGVQAERRDEDGLTALDYLERDDGISLAKLLVERRRRKCVELLKKCPTKGEGSAVLTRTLGSNETQADLVSLQSGDTSIMNVKGQAGYDHID